MDFFRILSQIRVFVALINQRFLQKFTKRVLNVTRKGGGHNGPKSLILAPQDIPDISGYQLGFGCQCVRAYNNENPVTNQKIL